MKRLSGSTRLRILAVLIVIVVLWLAFRNYNEYQTNLEEVSVFDKKKCFHFFLFVFIK